MAVMKVIELIGTSTKGWQAAAEDALATSAKTIRDIVGVEVVSWSAQVADQQIAEYHARVKVSFRVREKVD
ncbi:MAG: dodecin domain-containing protein [Armatimonadota bacterium]|nr:MAG: dodecin domain-containing protein [Armatimonadota bacterium]